MKLFWTIFFLIVFINAKSQVLINKSEKAVIEAVNKNDGIIKKTRPVDSNGFSWIAFTFPDNIKKQKGIYSSEFDFKKGLCYRYSENYAGIESVNLKIAELDNKNSGFIRQGKKQFWISADKKYQIEISEYLNKGMHTNRYVFMISGERGYFADNYN